MTEAIRIMVVEDHHVVRQGLMALIKTVPGLEVVADASDGKQAIAQFRQYKPDITLMDLRLPNLGGVDAITAIRSEFPGARIIVLTTFDGDEDIYRERPPSPSRRRSRRSSADKSEIDCELWASPALRAGANIAQDFVACPIVWEPCGSVRENRA